MQASKRVGRKIFLYGLMGGQCLFFTGCKTWFQPEEPKADVEPKSAMVGKGPGKQSQGFAEADVSSEQKASKFFEEGQKKAIRALPRRPVASINRDEEAKAATSFLEAEAPLGSSEASLEGQSYHVVQKGDTLWKIARLYSVNLPELKLANDLTEKEMIYPGMKLIIPGGAKVAEVETPQNASSYKVQKGDTLSLIAKKFNLSVDAIKSANGLNSDIIITGKELVLPGVEASKISLIETEKKRDAKSEKKMNDSSGGAATYVVQPGDTLTVIAQKTGVNVSRLISLNQISDPRNLQIGQTLQLGTLHENKSLAPSTVASPTSIESSDREPVVSFKEDEKGELKMGTDTSTWLEEKTEGKAGSSDVKEEVEEKAEMDNEFDDLFEDTNAIPVVPIEES